MKTKHTTGPWRIAEIGQSWKVKDECVIATCENATGVYSVCILAKTNTNHYTKTDAEANVKLIASAPELLQMVFDLKNCIRRLTSEKLSQMDIDKEAQWEGEAHELLLKINPDYYSNANA